MVVAEAQLTLVECATMLVFGLGLSLLGVGLFCGFLFTVSTYALPVATGLLAGFAAVHVGAPTPAAAVIGVLVALTTLALGWFAVAVTPLGLLKVPIALAFAVPAALAGYHLAAGLGRLGLPHGVWLETLGGLRALCSGVTAWVRMTRFPQPTF